MGSAGPNGTHSKAIQAGPGVVIGRSGASAGRVHYCPVDYWPHNTCLYVTDFLGNNPRFAYYYLQTIDLAAFNSGSAQPSLNRNYLYGIPVVTPSRLEQDSIVEILESIDNCITLLRETNATLEAIAQALFKSWFVDFDPVRAKMEGRSPEGMDEETATLFPDGLEETSLGTIPTGWNLCPLAHAFAVNPKRTLRRGEPAPYIDMASVNTQGHVVSSASMRDFGSGTKFVNGDTLLARITPCLENGKTAFVDCLLPEEVGWGSTEFVVLRPNPPLPPYFAYLLCRQEGFRDFAIQSMSGTSGRQRIQNDVLVRYPVAVPDEAVASAFAQVIEPLAEKIGFNHQQAQTLAGIRDTLLPRLISGKLRLPEAEAMAEEALAT